MDRKKEREKSAHQGRCFQRPWIGGNAWGPSFFIIAGIACSGVSVDEKSTALDSGDMVTFRFSAR